MINTGRRGQCYGAAGWALSLGVSARTVRWCSRVGRVGCGAVGADGTMVSPGGLRGVWCGRRGWHDGVSGWAAFPGRVGAAHTMV